MFLERGQRARNAEPALDDDDRDGQQMEQAESRIPNPFPTADRSEHDGGLAEYDKQDVGHVKTHGSVGGDAK